jgi:hypothetical protein
MSAFFLVVEVFSYLFALFLLFRKQDLAVIYVPVLAFTNNIIEPVFSASLYYGSISLLILAGVVRNRSFFQNNIFAFLIFLYFLILLPGSSDIVMIRPHLFAVLWLFVSIPLIAAVYQKYSEDVIFKEITTCALIILVLFIANVGFSTIHKYSPNAMYGITKGIMYGNIYAAGFNILAIAIFITTLKFLDTKKPLYLAVLILSIAFLMLSLRRSVMLVAIIGVAIAFLSLLTQKDAKKFLVLGTIIYLLGYGVIANTDFMSQFNERYELRKLDERELESESRFVEYELIYKDMFVYNDYSPWFGYELLNSSGHYGKGIFELRTLHSDLTSIAHSSGIIGVIIYLLMVITAFRRSYKAATTPLDKLILFFGAVAFMSYMTTGRWTECGAMILLFLVIGLPLAGKGVYSNDKLSADNYQMGNMTVDVKEEKGLLGA